jgi:putative acetyltransferase
MIVIRSEQNKDSEAIHEVNRLAFGQEEEALLVQRIRESSHFIPELSIVIGHPNYYPRFGFVPAGQKGLKAPFPVPDEAFMVLELAPKALTGIKGTVTYPPEFDEMT